MTEEPSSPSFEPGRKLRVGLNVAIAVAALLAVVILLNCLAARNSRRWDVSGSDRFDLSPLTVQILGALTNTVKVTALFDPEAPLAGMVEGLLREYERRAPGKVDLRVVDFLRQPGLANNIKAQYKLGADAANLVVFECAGRIRAVYATELSVYEADRNFARNREVHRTGFRGEMMFTSALAGVMDAKPPRVCFLEGHGEHDPESEEPLLGYSRFTRLLAERNVSLDRLSLMGPREEIPADCELLIAAGSQNVPTPGELARIEKYLDAGGRLLLLTHPYTLALDRPTGFEALLEKWGVIIGRRAAADEINTLSRIDVLTKNLAVHPITSPISKISGFLYFPQPRVVSRIPEAVRPSEALHAENLVLTSTNGLTKSQFRDGVAYHVPGRDFNGEVPLAVAVEKGGLAGVAASRGVTRIVVIGDSSVFANDALSQSASANRDFANLTLAWLLDRSQFLAVGPKPVREYRLALTDRQLQTLRLTVLGALPGGTLLLGMAVWLRRRS